MTDLKRYRTDSKGESCGFAFCPADLPICLPPCPQKSRREDSASILGTGFPNLNRILELFAGATGIPNEGVNKG
jgi:hypothetical protein